MLCHQRPWFGGDEISRALAPRRRGGLCNAWAVAAEREPADRRNTQENEQDNAST
jgi:hypothetical protein